LIIYGSGRLSGGTVNSYSDHRIVMAAAVLSVISSEKITITGAEAADKSYPSFFEDFKALGGEFDVEY
ncbi:MAG: 3-phosphoshikimate 1-carboxyvinyltransferase, partial [Clostridia bacterium]|nr:3-phosphoshikimate 1-carboxyvinyltransferase [Clostridia bacterium]